MRLVLAATAALGVLALAQPAAHAAGSDSAITHIQHTKAGFKLLVSVPADADVSLDDVSVTVDGTRAEATAAVARSGDVRRTEMLVIDTSNSMKGAKFQAAKAAALQFLDAVPEDVYVGIVTFDEQVTTDLQPTQDRSAAAAVIDGLKLSGGTHLYDGVVTAVHDAGKAGQQSLLVLSDGADASKTPLDTATSAISKAKALVDVVAVDQDADSAALAALADAGKGQVLSADPGALAATFASEALALARQVVVNAEVPATFTGTDATVQVDFGAVSASAFGRVRAAGPPQVAATAAGFVLPDWGMYAGTAALGIGIAFLLILIIPKPAGPMTAEQRITSYTVGTSRGARRRGGANADSDDLLDSAKTAAAGILKRNADFEAKIAARLDAAGSELKPAEWLLLHSGIAVVVTLLGLLLGGGSLVLGFVFLGVGILVPWMYLGVARNRRRKAFGKALPDTLQLISGSLAAGLSLAQSLDTVANDGTEPVASEFRRVLVETRLGVNLEDALEGVAERFESKDFGWVVMAIGIQRQVGGNLAELLDTVAATMREREYLRRQVSALAAEGKLSAIVLGLLPPLFVLYLCATNWTYVSVLFTDIRGILMLAGGTLWLGLGVFWMSRLVKVEV
ncbi:tight adherence protein B [Nocardioides terrae]|uniref:Tight adherence protein B n=1 Tax=Nocardioides terrae TaxID=574651 RepID=A0A1I1G316_9ACTN|nr:type II secretion system F family protein [Nocardioides terrae]SFC06219.1 tight adherence protein B [Nocardioides terrae]